MSSWLWSRNPRTFLVLLVAVFSIGGQATAAKKLPVKTLEMIEGNWVEIVEGVGTGLTRSGGGATVRKVLTKVPGKIPWGGAVSIVGQLIPMAIQWAVEEGQRESIPKPLNDWFNDSGTFPQIKTVTLGDNRTYEPAGNSCQGYYVYGDYPTSVWFAYTSANGRYAAIMAQNRSGSVSLSSSTDLDSNAANEQVSQWCSAVKTSTDLATVARQNPEIVPFIKDLVTRYVDAKPEFMRPYLEPLPTTNQFDGSLTDPTAISVPGSKYSDGDYLQELPSQPGNRRIPALDGSPLEPWPGSGTPVDTDGDGIPDYRDADDNNDGVPDDQQTEQDQKSKPGEPGYGRRPGDTGTKTVITEGPTPDGRGKRRTVTTTTSNPDGSSTTRQTHTDRVTEKTYEPGTPPGPNGEPGTPGTITTTTTTTTTTNITYVTINKDGTTTSTTTTTTNTSTDTTSEPGPSPAPGDIDGDGVKDENDPAPNDPTKPEKPGGPDDPSQPPNFDHDNLPKWNFQPIATAIQDQQQKFDQAKQHKLPFALGEMLPTFGSVGSDCPSVKVETAYKPLGQVTLVVCESAPSQWMHGTGRSIFVFVLTCIFIVAVVNAALKA